MATPARLGPLLAQFDFAYQRLRDRLTGPVMDSGNGTPIRTDPLTDEEYLWEPVAGCWSVRPRTDGPGPRATRLLGGGDWGRDSASGEHPWPPPFTTIAWRMTHLSELLALRADYTVGGRSMTFDDCPVGTDAASAVAILTSAAEAWRGALLRTDDAALDEVGHCTYPYGGDAEEPFVEVVWWVNQEVLHHGAEIALLRDLHRDRGLPSDSRARHPGRPENIAPEALTL
ncbi:DinB family protein [Kitasatospora sp. RB6PN24]|uniref:DinB family protein n=1 Tax=Kitasatospora humi TaxID=2893891 RepID=UPI001E3FBBAC|nr:DinB family protein [Kitasatospora humi]MCC9306281.1 DinB family protein [Kitasatospora humi]